MLPPDATALPPGYDRTDYRAPSWRRLLYALIVLLLLPFAASLPILIFQRAAFGASGALLPLLAVSLFLVTLFVLAAAQLVRGERASVHLGAEALSFALPARGTLHPFRFREAAIAYRDIKAVEVRSDVIGGTWAPLLVFAVHLITHDGRDVFLGHSGQKDFDRAFPFLLIARQMAKRSRVRLIFDPHVWRTVTNRRHAARLGVIPGTPHALSSAAISNINQKHRRTILLLANLAILVIVIGVTHDFAAR